MSDTSPTVSSSTTPGTYAGVSVQEAAVRLGVSINTVRHWIKIGKLQADRITRPQGSILRVYLPDEPIAASNGQVPADATYQDTHQGSNQDSPQVPAHVPDLARAEAMAAYSKALIEPLVQELSSARQQVADLAHLTGQQQERIAVLEAQLAKPPSWWHRFWSGLFG